MSSARLRAVLGSVALCTVVLVPLGVSSLAVAAPAGITWTSQTSAADNIWNSVTYGNGLFVAVSGTPGLGNRVMTSPDGVTWTSRTSAADNFWNSVAFGDDTFVAVASNGFPNQVMTSPDGVNWTARTPAADNNWISVTYGKGLFVAVSFGGPGSRNRVMTSPDGVIWTIGTTPSDNTWESVTYGDDTFVAVSSDGSGDRVMTSPDGVTWTARTSAADNSWNSVTYGNGLFVAVSSASSGGNQVMTSPDGITWTSQTPPAPGNRWTSVTYGNGLFVAVSRGPGSGNRVMIGGNPPGVPVITGVTAGQTSAAVAFTADDSGGSAITRLEFALDDTTAVDDSTTSLSSPYTLNNLSPGYGYTVYMRAVNAVGAGPWSAPQAFATPAPTPPPPPPVFPPGAPRDVVGAAGDREVAVSWQPPSDSGSFPVTDYRVVASPGGASCLAKAPTLTCTVTGLTNGTAYTFVVTALNGAGWGAPSAASAPVTPSAPVVRSLTLFQGQRVSDGRHDRIRTAGMSTGIPAGARLTPWIRYGATGEFKQGVASIVVDDKGGFTWTRQIRKDRSFQAYVAFEDLESNSVIWRKVS